MRTLPRDFTPTPPSGRFGPVISPLSSFRGGSRRLPTCYTGSVMREIQLTRGLVALVDDDDHEWLSQWKWYALEGNNGRFYAGRGIRIDGRRTHLSMQSALMQPGPGCEVDHEDGNGLNIQRSNLRSAT